MTLTKPFKPNICLLKGILITIGIWLILFGIFHLSNLVINVDQSNCGFGESCYNIIAAKIISIFTILGSPIIKLLGGYPTMSTAGPEVYRNFFIGSAISFALWGVIIDLFIWIFRKTKKQISKN